MDHVQFAREGFDEPECCFKQRDCKRMYRLSSPCPCVDRDEHARLPTTKVVRKQHRAGALACQPWRGCPVRSESLRGRRIDDQRIVAPADNLCDECVTVDPFNKATFARRLLRRSVAALRSRSARI
jgi:hypothetical protein